MLFHSIDNEQNAHKRLTKSGKKTQHDHEIASKGHTDLTHHKVEDKVGGGKKSQTHSQKSHQSSKHVDEHSQHGAKFQDASKKKKTNFEKVKPKE